MLATIDLLQLHPGVKLLLKVRGSQTTEIYEVRCHAVSKPPCLFHIATVKQQKRRNCVTATLRGRKQPGDKWLSRGRREKVNHEALFTNNGRNTKYNNVK